MILWLWPFTITIGIAAEFAKLHQRTPEVLGHD